MTGGQQRRIQMPYGRIKPRRGLFFCGNKQRLGLGLGDVSRVHEMLFRLNLAVHSHIHLDILPRLIRGLAGICAVYPYIFCRRVLVPGKEYIKAQFLANAPALILIGIRQHLSRLNVALKTAVVYAYGNVRLRRLQLVISLFCRRKCVGYSYSGQVFRLLP